MLSEGRRRLLFDLDKMRKCAPVKHTGETLVIFGLTESDREANVITDMAAECLLPSPSQHDTQRSSSYPIRKFTLQS